jgi:hypothetical protein
MFKIATLCTLAMCSFGRVVTGTPQSLWVQTSETRL